MPKQTADLIALILAVVVAVVVLATALTLLYLEVTVPDADNAQAADAIGKLVSVLVGALVGYMAGRQIKNGNGHS